MSNQKIEYASAQRQGARPYQEDSFQVVTLEQGVLAVVCDGMGGHAGGDLASRTASETFSTVFSERIQAGSSADMGLKTALNEANMAIRQAIHDGGPEGMGTTLVAAWVAEASIWWISVGDSLLLQKRADGLHRLNADHSMGGVLDDMAKIGRITPEEARSDPRRHVLRSALSGDEIDLVDTGYAKNALKQYGGVLLGSDGLETLESHLIGRVLKSGVSPDRKAQKLMTQIEKRAAPHQDNVTVVILQNFRRGWFF